MYRWWVVSLLRKLARLAPPPAQPAPTAPANGPMLEELRARIQAVIERTARRAAPPPPAVDTPELPFSTIETSSGPLHVRTQQLSAAHRTGVAPLLPARDASAELLALLALDPTLADCEPSRALYLD